MSDKQKDLLQTVKDVFTNKKYNIPIYQRGYKWDTEQVKKLLEDIYNYKCHVGDENRFYCLQNITITKNTKYTENDALYDVIDGQQRLTTLAILLAALGKYDLIKDKLTYSIRKESGAFLKFILDNDVDAIKECEEKKEDYDRQDIHYFKKAHETINTWLEKENKNKDAFKVKLLTNVKLIVNVVSNASQEKIFANLNSNKVPLSKVDLIRAILITRCSTISSNDTSKIVEQNEKRVRLANELDNYNTYWLDEAKSSIFSKLLKESKGIELLYLLFFNKNNSKDKDIDIIFTKIDNPENEDILSKLDYFHNTLDEWYNDREIYHYLGFLAYHHSGLKIQDIYNLWNKAESKSKFKIALKEKIKDTLIKDYKDEQKESEISKDEKTPTPFENYIKDIENVNNAWYSDNQSLLKSTLVLLDIIKLLERKDNTRLPYDVFKPKDEDIEHIFCQTPKKDKWENGDAKELVRFLQETYKDNNNIKDINVEADDFDNSYGTCMTLLHQFSTLHNIGNLVLLNSGINRGYGNSVYSEKRKTIITKADNGEYIRPHTLSVFTKSFENTDLNLWTLNDIKENAKNISKLINDFFKEEIKK